MIESLHRKKHAQVDAALASSPRVPSITTHDQRETVPFRLPALQTPSTKPRQLPLSPALRTQQATSLKRRLSTYLDGNLELTVTDNRAVMVTVKRDAKHHRFIVRAHHLFCDCPEPVLRDLVNYIVFDQADAAVRLHDYVEAQHERILPDEPIRKRKTVIRTEGRVYDLKTIFDHLNETYFDRRVDAEITWGRHAGKGKSRSTINVGSYTVEEQLIRIHPGLDQVWVPYFYVQWVVYHEMLHVLHPIETNNGRRHFHPPEFLVEEQKFSHYAHAKRWENNNLPALLSI